MNLALILLVAGTCLALGKHAGAQDGFPSRPVRMIVPYPGGGGGDILARALAQAFQKATNQPLVVESRPGAGGMIGTAACKSAAPDGYTYCLPASDVMAINPSVFKSVPYDAELVQDERPVGRVTSSVPAEDGGSQVALAYVRCEVARDAILRTGERAVRQTVDILP